MTWNPKPDYDAATASFHFPKCGEDFAPEAQAVGGITPEPIATPENDPTFGDMVMVTDNFVSDDGERTGLLAAPYNYVITLDGKVVYSSQMAGGDSFYGMNYYNANVPSGNNGGMGISPGSLCDGQAASEAYATKISGLSDDEQQPLWDTFYEDWTKFKPGTYKLYIVTPIVFGEQAALGQLFALDGITDTSSLSQDISWTPLAEDPRIAPYCAGSMDFGDYTCTPPPDVVKDVLTRQVDPAKINDTDPGIGISEPLEYTVP